MGKGIIRGMNLKLRLHRFLVVEVVDHLGKVKAKVLVHPKATSDHAETHLLHSFPCRRWVSSSSVICKNPVSVKNLTVNYSGKGKTY